MGMAQKMGWTHRFNHRCPSLTWHDVDEEDFTETPDKLHGFQQFNLVTVVLSVHIFHCLT